MIFYVLYGMYEYIAVSMCVYKGACGVYHTSLLCQRTHQDDDHTDVWYSIQREAKTLYGTGWKSQSRVKRKLDNIWGNQTSYPVWFDVPEQSFASWISVKYAVSAKIKSGK